MHTIITARGTSRDELRKAVRNAAGRTLGRLQRHVSHAEFSFEAVGDTDRNTHQCTLRLRPRKGGDVLVRARCGGREAAPTVALRQARRALMRRWRTTLRLSRWLKSLQLALA